MYLSIKSKSAHTELSLSECYIIIYMLHSWTIIADIFTYKQQFNVVSGWRGAMVTNLIYCRVISSIPL